LKEKLKSYIWFTLFAFLGIFLFWLVYKDQPVHQIIEALKEANFFYIGLSLFLALLSHISRALRWNILIHSMGYKPRTLNTFFAVMVMYISNTAIPRSGEVARCGVLNKYENIPLTKLFGTVIVERVFDFLMLLVLLCIVIFTQSYVIEEFLAKNPETGVKFAMLLNSKNLFILSLTLIFLLILALLFRKKILKNKLYLKFSELFNNVLIGIKTVKNLEKKWQFIFHTVFIWAMYFSMIYVVFLSFEFTSHLSLLTSLTVFVMSSFGMVAPSPGGIGTWHFMVIETLVIYGLEKYPYANVFAFAAHGSMTLFVVFLGSVSLILLPIVNKRNNKIAV
jgi:uncharacterized protein (TIRG00374 family)